MIHSKQFKKRNPYLVSVLLLALIYVIAKAIHSGTDINVYLYASKQILNGSNIYTENPFNNYLYSPLFALLLTPISIFNLSVGRVLWAVFNLIVTIRLWRIAATLINDSFNLKTRDIRIWTIGVVVLSLGFLNHNFILGQITITILWLTFEGLYQIIYLDKPIKGAIMLALGINIKIIPFIALPYLFIKGKYKAFIICMLFLGASFILPSAIIGHKYNMELLNNWTQIINPSSNKYVFENDTKTQSLNAVLPAYFFKEYNNTADQPNRLIADVSYKNLLIALQTIRILLAISLLAFAFINHKGKHPLIFFWEFAYLALITILIFPHQQKYAMLYFAPAASYMLLFFLWVCKSKWKVASIYMLTSSLAILLIFIASIMGRDIIGKHLAGILDYYHTFGVINMAFVLLLILSHPKAFILTDKEKQTKSQLANTNAQ